jgi:hypothetical protein
MIELLQNYEINIQPGFINFNPYSTLEGLEKNIAFLEKYGFGSNIFILSSRVVIYKGTLLYHKIKKDSLLAPEAKNYSEYEYSFVQEPVAHLYNYIDNYCKTIDKDFNSELFLLSYYYSMAFLTLLTHLKRQFKIENKNEGHACVIHHEKQNKQILADINHHACQWFKRLLTLAGDGWDPGKAREISANNLSPAYITETVAILGQNKNKLYKKLVRLNLDSYIVDMV